MSIWPGDWWPLGATSRPALSGCGESPGSGDDLSPGWRRTWAHRESSHGRQGTCSETPGRYRDINITSHRRGQRPRPARLRAHPAVGAGPAIRDRACGLTGATARGGNRRLGLALLVIATAQLMVVLDATIVNVALPTWSLVTRPSPRDHGHLT